MAISAAELAQIQADLVAAVCDKTCLVQRATSSASDGMGSSVPTFTTVATTVCGMHQPTSTHLQNYAYLIDAESSWQVHLPYGTVVNPTDHLIIEGQTLEVHVILEPHSVPGLVTVLVAEIK